MPEMPARLVRVAALFGLVLGAAAHAEESPAAASDAAPNADSQPEKKSRLEGWQFFHVMANIWPRLEESEDKIDKQLNKGLGRLFPRWEEPTTFKDWRNDFKMWDLQIGVSKDIGKKWAVAVTGGAVEGLIPNSEKYYFPLPVKVNANMERQSWSVSVAADYYFRGRPSLDPATKGQNPVARRLRAAKPYAELCTGYVNVKGRCTVSFERPVLGKLFRYTDKFQHDLFFVSPRIGIDIPVTKKDSVSFMAGPLFFTSHEKEYNNVAFYTVFRHRF
jgi:hypothetical protein